MRKQNNAYNNHPRDSVSWYQAVAFTHWLTAKRRAAGLLSENEEIRLPTEKEWEYAPRGIDEHRYLYPGNFDSARGNTKETGIGRSSAVGLFLDGASPFSVLDMSGNLWEWCLNDYQNREFTDGYGNGKYKVLRGGSFYFVQDFAASSFRNLTSQFYHPSNTNLDYGLRLVACPIGAL
jgi:formylglycine-generating enzyme required for sulfatase activity